MKRTHMLGLAGFVFLATLAFGDKIQEPLASIHGVVEVSTPKTLIVETADSNALEFFCTRKTRYIEGKKKITSADLNKGDLVTVESRTNLLGDAEAVNVYREPRKPSENK
jgi:hypothetical protein